MPTVYCILCRQRLGDKWNDDDLSRYIDSDDHLCPQDLFCNECLLKYGDKDRVKMLYNVG